MRLDRPQVDAHRTTPQRAHHQRDRQRHPLVRFTAERRKPLCHMDIRGLEDTGVPECPQDSRGGERLERHATALPASSRSDRPATNDEGGRQLNTPDGCPSITGVSGPHIPRTNR